MRTLIKTIQAILILISCNSYADQVAIKTSSVQQLTIDQSIVLDAQVEAINQTTLSAQTSGQITDIFIDAGDIVNAGDILLKLKDDNQQASYKSAQATLKATKAELVDATKSLKRIKEIFAKRLSSQQDLDNAKARYNIAKANYDGANAQLNSAKEQLRYTIIKAPYSGIVLERHINLGEIVAPGTPLFTGTSLNQLRVISQIPQRDIKQVKQFSKAKIILPNGEKFVQQDNEIKFYAYASPQSSTFKVRIALPKENKNLYPGMYLKAYFKIGTRTALVIPSSALIKRSELRGVYVQDKKGRIHLRQVREGDSIEGDFVEILAGLSINETVITNPTSVITMLISANKTSAEVK
ncbi:MAG: efflux RND transporter periplasmic adaptor subunit [Alteromonadaceae bacterium]|nr:efflux RND transporter periplasmic adaptor subunit [Alteromonadaceae bacterium]